MLDSFSCLHTQVEYGVAKLVDVSGRLNWQFAHLQVENVTHSSNQAHPCSALIQHNKLCS